MSILTTIRKVLTLTCEESTRLVSESLDGEITRSDRFALNAHALCCRSCRRFRRQIPFLREAARRHRLDPTTSMANPSDSLTPEARERIRATLLRRMPEDLF